MSAAAFRSLNNAALLLTGETNYKRNQVNTGILMALIIPVFLPSAFEMTLDARVKCNRLTAPHLVLNRFQRMQAVSLLALGKISNVI